MDEVVVRTYVREYTSKDKKYKQIYIYLPSDLVKDSKFPLKRDEPQKIRISIQGKKLVIEPIED
ncbi:MAG: hypothetical protein ACP6IU_13090 [Candidatus Asgardarchaeia archaeon]